MAQVVDYKTLTSASEVLTNEFLSTSLSKWFKEEVKFTHWEHVGKTGEGDSYLSELMRIKIYGCTKNGDSRHVQVILKNIPKNVCRRLTYRSDEFFKNEISFYDNVLLSLLKFQSSKNMTDPYKGYVDVFFSHFDKTKGVISLMDATLENYQGLVRQGGTDFEHCKAAFKALAQFHAMSFAMKDQQSEEFDKIKNALFETYYDDRLKEWYLDFWAIICGIAVDAVEKEFPNTIYEKKIKKFAVPETYDDMIRAVKENKNGVISHGDTWITNFLYKYENSKPVDTKIIDFQLARCANPVLDLTFFIYSCTDQEMRLKHYDDLLSHYYTVLSTQIREMGSDPDKVYSLNQFMDDMKKYSYFGLGFSFESTPFTVLDNEDNFDMNMEGDEKKKITDFWKVKPYKTKEARLRAANNVVFCVDRGYI
ncbi:ecdysteroid kinase domain-containing protein [Phthorimaea operculella]|nr:ecdysteroid kinase domain-containing protein [Phthorimaea operculella]